MFLLELLCRKCLVGLPGGQDAVGGIQDLMSYYQ